MHDSGHGAGLLKKPGDLGPQGLLRHVHLDALFARQGPGFVGGHGLAVVADEREDQVTAFAKEPEPSLFGKGFKLGEGARLLAFVGGLDA
ncbi:hypothetical protein RZS08_16630, partial [Arthrospira platensis SPKY1]|nr:hypothetical protein [Arthrospira platensis SPKY1]